MGTRKIWSLAYADDVVVMAKTIGEMKELIERLEKYFERRRLTVNVRKTKWMVCKNVGGRRKNEELRWRGEEIERVKEFKYLGYMFGEFGGKTRHTEFICKKARVAMERLKNT